MQLELVKDDAIISGKQYNNLVSAVNLLLNLNAVGAEVHWGPNPVICVSSSKGASGAAGPQGPPGTGGHDYWGRISASTYASGMWTYNWMEAASTSGGWVSPSGAVSGTAKNMAEVPSGSYKYRPVPSGSVVALYSVETSGASGSTWWFSESMNQDTNTAVSGSSLKTLAWTTALNSDTWSLTADQGKGVAASGLTELFYSSTDHKFYQRLRGWTADDSGRLIGIGAESQNAFFTAKQETVLTGIVWDSPYLRFTSKNLWVIDSDTTATSGVVFQAVNCS
jgi:hypothetical protein